MYLSKITGNILNKFNQQNINILYDPQYNLFDILLAECGLNLFVEKNDRFVNLESSCLTMLDDNHMDLFNYNVGISNNIVLYSQQKKYDILHLNTIIFTHSCKPQQIKKEDVLLLRNSLKKQTKVFFDINSQSSWKVGDSAVIRYGIPQDKFYSENDGDRSNRVLMFNCDRNPSMPALAQFLEKNNILVDIVKDISCDADILRSLLNQYDVCIDLADHNISNLLVAIACGCKGISYATPMIMENYSNTPNLYTAATVQDLILCINRALESKKVSHIDYFKKHHCFNKFRDSINTLVIDNNNRAFI